MITTRFTNKHYNPVEIHWKDGNNSELHAYLGTGESYEQHAHEGQAWSIIDKVDGSHIMHHTSHTDGEHVELQKKQGHKYVPKESRSEKVNALAHPGVYNEQSALYYDGVKDFVLVKNSSSINLKDEWTIEAWIYRHTENKIHIILEKYDKNKGGYLLKVGRDNRLKGGILVGKQFFHVKGTTKIQAYKWYHVAVTFSSSKNKMTCYVNSIPESSVIRTGPYLRRNNLIPALGFSGYLNYVDAPIKGLNKNKFTFSFWFNTNDPNAGLASLTTSKTDLEVYLKNGIIYAKLGNAITKPKHWLASKKNIANGEWKRAAVVYDKSKGELKLYVNAHDNKPVASVKTTNTLSGTSGILKIGYASKATDSYFTGEMSEVTIWNTARSENDILDYFKQELIGTEANLKGYWKLNKGSGVTFKDKTGNNNNATINYSGPTSMEDYSINAGKNNITVPKLKWTPTKFSVTFWMKPKKLTNAQQIKATNGWGAFCFDVLSDGKIKTGIDSTHVIKTKTGTVKTNTWQHVAFTFQKTSSTTGLGILYVNGVIVGRNPKMKLPVKWTGFQIGNTANTAKNINGKISEIAVWSKALSQKEIDKAIQKSISGTANKLKALWIAAASGSTIKDASPNGFNATINGKVTCNSVHRPIIDTPSAPKWDLSSTLNLVPTTMSGKGNTNDLRIGKGHFLWRDHYFHGVIDSVRLWSVSLSASELKSTFNENIPLNSKGLEAYWMFDDRNHDTTEDQTGNGNTGILGNGNTNKMPAWQLSTLLLLDGLQFDGQNDFVSLSTFDTDFSSGFSVEAWVYFSSYNNNPVIIDLGTGDNFDNLKLYSEGSSGKLVFEVNKNSNSKTLKADGVLLSDQWMHVAATLNGNKGKLYANGVKVAEGTLQKPKNITRNVTSLGKSSSSNNHYFDGKIDEVRIWSAARSDAQIKGFMQRIITVYDPQLVALWAFTEGHGLTAYDWTRNGHNALLGDGNEDNAPAWLLEDNRPNIGLQFNGTNNYVSVKKCDSINLTIYSAEVWIKPNGIPSATWSGILGKNGLNYTILLKNNGVIRQRFHNSSSKNATIDTPANSINWDEWNHISITNDGTTVCTYINGVLAVSGDAGGTPISDNNDLYIGAAYTSNNSKLAYFDGQLDDVRLWNIALTQQQIQTDMFHRISKNTPGLSAYWPMDENYGTQIRDEVNGVIGNFSGSNEDDQPMWVAVSPLQFGKRKFDGAGEYVKVPGSTSLNINTDFTITAWVNPKVYTSVQAIISKFDYNHNAQYALSIDGEKLRFDYGPNGFTVIGGQINEGWNFVAVSVKTQKVTVDQMVYDKNGNPVYENAKPAHITKDQDKKVDGDKIKSTTDKITVNGQTLKVPKTKKVQVNQPLITLYIDGFAVNSGTAPIASSKNNTPVILAAWQQLNEGQFFHGQLDSINVWKKALSQEDIQGYMHERVKAPFTDVAASWVFDSSTSKTIVDRSPNKNDGTVKYTNRSELANSIKKRSYLQFNGTDTKASAPASPAALSGNVSFTVSFWINYQLQSADIPLLDIGNGKVNQSLIFTLKSNGDASFGFRGRGVGLRNKFKISNYENKWVNVITVYDASIDTLSTYVKGTFQDSTIPDNSSINLKAGTIKFGKSSSSQSPYKGMLANVAIWDYAFDEKEIKTYPDLLLNGSEEGLLAYYPFNDGDGKTIRDYTAYRNDAAVTGTATWKRQTNIQSKATALPIGPIIPSLSLDGKNQYLAGKLSNVSAVNFIMTTWFKTNKKNHGIFEGKNMTYSDGTNSDNDLNTYLKNGLLHFDFDKQNVKLKAKNNVFSDNIWHFLVVGCDFKNRQMHLSNLGRWNYAGQKRNQQPFRFYI